MIPEEIESVECPLCEGIAFWEDTDNEFRCMQCGWTYRPVEDWEIPSFSSDVNWQVGT